MRHLLTIGAWITAAIMAVGLAVGCASTPLKTESATSGIRAAEEVRADQVPRAALHLQLAKEELARAKALHKQGDDEEGVSFLRRAEADAELAVLLAREQAEINEAEAARERVRQLMQDN